MRRQRYFGDRLNELPLILAGPVLRQVDQSSVSVWLALKDPATLKLSVFETASGEGHFLRGQCFEGDGQTVRLGTSLHLAVITTQAQILPSCIYAYDLEIISESDAIKSLASLPKQQYGDLGLSYFEHGLPTFATPAAQLADLKLMHGSCRKPHGNGDDLLVVLDAMLQTSATQPSDRIQQVYFTGDQIYGDDVADPLLWMATDVGDMLLGWTEALPIGRDETIESYALVPGVRSEFAKEKAGLTSTFGSSDQVASSHFFSFGEYLAAYLLVWSPSLWPQSFPSGLEVKDNVAEPSQWNQDVQKLEEFVASLPFVRRALANVSTYMICDDHDVSDDWYLNRDWCERVLSHSLGYRVVFNGLLAYAFCQAWGNDPAQFSTDSSGEQLCQFVTQWSDSGGTDPGSEKAIAAYLGLPPQSSLFRADESVEVLNRDARALKWHYRVSGPCHEVIVADTRTWRGYPKGDAIAPPWLLSPSAFEQQLSLPLAQGSCQKLTFILLPTNLVCLSLIDQIQSRDLSQGRVFRYDVGDSWNFNTEAFTQLLLILSRSREDVVVLTGDIHYSCAIKLQIWDALRTQRDRNSTIIQLTCSAIKNAETASHFAHTRFKSLIPESDEDWLGWKKAPAIKTWVFSEGRNYSYTRNDGTNAPVWHPTQNFITYQGKTSLSWTSRPTLESSPPDWRFRLAWIPRQETEKTPYQLTSPKQKKPLRWISWLWTNRWVQEGPTVVGHNNVGVISIQHQHDNLCIKQECYWVAPWSQGQVVKSQYTIPLNASSFETG